MFSIEFSSYAEKFLKKIEKVIAKRIIEKIEKLGKDPSPKEVKRIVNQEEKIFRVRVGEYRIQYLVLYTENKVLITDMDKRARAYD